MESPEEKILAFLKRREAEETSQNYGTSRTEVEYQFQDLQETEINNALNNLYKQKKIIVKPLPMIGKIIFLNDEK